VACPSCDEKLRAALASQGRESFQILRNLERGRVQKIYLGTKALLIAHGVGGRRQPGEEDDQAKPLRPKSTRK